MSPDETRQKGFSLVELMMAIVILGILVSYSIPSYLDNIRHSKETQCLVNRKAVERVAITHYNTFDQLSGNAIPGVEEFISMGYFDTEPRCPNGGLYIWAQDFYREDLLPQLACSYHFIPPVTPQKPGKSYGGKNGQ
jgi:prepilin-type N-terminal cleavage/methylation domain-containing protein